MQYLSRAENKRWNKSKSVLQKNSPALEVVTHRRLDRKFGPAESRTPQKGLNLGVIGELQNRTADGASRRTAVLVREQVNNS